jgi:small-conductance mechanosensitive channel
MVIGLIFSLFSIALPIALVVWAVRQFGNRKDSRGMDAHSVRRFFQYLLLFGLMVVAAVGLSDLLGMLSRSLRWSGTTTAPWPGR